MLVKNAQNENGNDEHLQEKLQEIKGQEGFIGYILRGSKSAAIDLKDPTKIIDYAVFSSAVFDLSCNMTDTLQVGDVNTIIVESEKMKLLSMNVNNQRLSIFMEKSVDHDKLYKNLK